MTSRVGVSRPADVNSCVCVCTWCLCVREENNIIIITIIITTTYYCMVVFCRTCGKKKKREKNSRQNLFAFVYVPMGTSVAAVAT